MKIDRRRFIGQAVGFAAAGALFNSLPSAFASPIGLPIGIQLYTVGDFLQKDAAATVKRIAQIGYKEVETAGFGSAGSAAALRKLLDENGLKCPSAHLNFDLKNLNKAFDDAHALGCKYATASVPRMMIAPPIDMSPGADRSKVMQQFQRLMSSPFTGDEIKKLVEVINQVGAAAKKEGLIFGAHNHGFEFGLVDGKPALYSMIEQTDKNNVVFELDCGWTEVSGFHPVEIIKAYPGRVRMLHIKDFLPIDKNATGAAARPKGSEIGQGFIDYKKMFEGLKGRKIEHIFVEQEGPFSRMPSIEAAKVDFDFLNGLK